MRMCLSNEMQQQRYFFEWQRNSHISTHTHTIITNNRQKSLHLLLFNTNNNNNLTKLTAFVKWKRLTLLMLYIIIIFFFFFFFIFFFCFYCTNKQSFSHQPTERNSTEKRLQRHTTSRRTEERKNKIQIRERIECSMGERKNDRKKGTTANNNTNLLEMCPPQK